MLSVKPLSLTTVFTCPDCGCKFGQAEQLVFQGSFVVADCLCECCENRYDHTLPIGHASLYPISISRKTEKVKCEAEAMEWLAKPFVSAWRNNTAIDFPIKRTVFKDAKEIVLLNCLDSCYGHVLLKLFNAHALMEKNPMKGIVVLIPSNFQWLLPDGLSEAWVVEIDKLSQLNKGVKNLDGFIKTLLQYYTSVELSEAPVHPDVSKIPLEKFLRVSKFDLNKFDTLIPSITFVLREDRFWTNNPLDAFMMKLAISKGILDKLKIYFVWKQNRLVNKLAKRITKKFDGKVLFQAIGIGASGKLSTEIKDYRKRTLSEQDERSWCELYAASHLVIGIHGSNMLLPTALSAGFIELLPRYKIYNITEDIAMDRKGRYMHFLGRYLDEYSSISLIAEHAASMLKWFPMIRKNMEA